jgi:hypothetical protein
VVDEDGVLGAQPQRGTVGLHSIRAAGLDRDDDGDHLALGLGEA